MRKSLYLIGILSSLVFPVGALASTSVNISSSVSNSTNSVNVQSNQSSSVNGTTDIRIESNGEVKTYHGTGNQSVHMESSDGNSQVTVNNQSSTTNGVSQNSSSASSQTNIVPLSAPAVEGTSSAQIQDDPISTQTSFNLMTFFQKEFAAISHFFNSLFH